MFAQLFHSPKASAACLFQIYDPEGSSTNIFDPAPLCKDSPFPYATSGVGKVVPMFCELAVKGRIEFEPVNEIDSCLHRWSGAAGHWEERASSKLKAKMSSNKFGCTVRLNMGRTGPSMHALRIP